MYDPRNNNSKFKDFFLPAIILLSGITISAYLFIDKNSPADNLSPSAILPLQEDTKRIKIEVNTDNPTLGNPNAPITIVEFADFQCGFCKIFAQEILPKLIDKHVKTGQAKFIFKDFAILGEDSKSSALAANCANEQNKFLEFHNELFSLKDENKPFSRENIINIANKLNLNLSKFNNCLGLEENMAAIEEDTKEGKLLGVKGTPTIFINGIKISGAQNFYIYDSIISEELKTTR